MSIIKSIRGLYLPREPKLIRKWTVISHWFFGAVCAYLTTVDRPFAAVVLTLFMLLEYWDDKQSGSKCGSVDFLDAFVVFIAGLVVVAILQGLHIAG